MCLVMITIVKEKLVVAQCLPGWLRLQYLLKPHHLAEGFGRIAYKELK
jgi:hypothetical protein